MIVPNKIILITSDICKDSRATALENYINGKIFGYRVIVVKESELNCKLSSVKNKLITYGIKYNINIQNYYDKTFKLKMKMSSPIKKASKKNVGKYKKINNLVNRFNAKALFCLTKTSLFSCIKAREKFKFDAKIIAFLDCFTAEKNSIYLGADKYIVENNNFKEELYKLGVKKEDIFVKRFPVDKDKFVIETKDECKAMFDLEGKTVLLYGGNIGNKKIAEIFKLLIEIKDRFSVAVYLGENEKLYDKLNKIKQDNNLNNVKLFTTINNVEKLFVASDVIVSTYDINAIYLAKLYNKQIIIFAPNTDVEINDLQYLNKTHEIIYSKDFSDVIVKVFDNTNNNRIVNPTSELKTSTAEVTNYIIEILGK